MKNLSFFSAILIIIIPFLNCRNSETEFHLKKGNSYSVFKKGIDGYACFRIPAIISTQNNILLAFAEGRKGGCSDTGDIDLVMKRSEDGGLTWGPIVVIWDDSTNTCGNPAPVVDQKTGTIHLLSTWNLGTDKEHEIINQSSSDTRHIYTLQSVDNGLSWTKPKEITSQVKDTSWTWYATGPGSGIQLQSRKYKDRLVVACDHIEAGTKKYFSHIIYSDDHGENWSLGGTTPKDQVNECEVAELDNGDLLLNMRNYDRSKKLRQTSISRDGGITWVDQKYDTKLIEPICQASLQKFQNTSILLFSNPANSDERKNMCLRLSLKNGEEWGDSVILHPGPAAYSDIVVDQNGSIGCLYEAGTNNPYEGIIFTQLTMNKNY